LLYDVAVNDFRGHVSRMPLSPTKILFMGEGATLAHVARPFLLACALDPLRFDITFARPSSHAWMTAVSALRTVDLPCQDGASFARRLEHGLPLYDFTTLCRYVEDDLALLDAHRPDVVVGDFRLSLAASARLRQTPYITICDAYWSPEYSLEAPLPALSFTRFTPIALAEQIFRLVAPLAMRLHARPMERLLARHGLPSFGHDLRRCYTDADLRLFANFTGLFPEVRTSEHAAFIGPLAWSAPADGTPTELRREGKTLVYATMGSSGNVNTLERIVSTLENLDCDVIASTAGRKLTAELRSSRTRVFDFLPGDLACRQASLVVCNGGSPTTNQALAHGVPVLGIAQNMDQFLNMRAIERAGVGLLLRADRLDRRSLEHSLTRLLNEPGYKERAIALCRTEDGRAPATRLAAHIDTLLARRTGS
jgi:UDP:flavonoid glycosyltransferase YjiC (YdhE family)